MSRYGQIILFKDNRSTLCRKDTGTLQKWGEKYNQLATLGNRRADNDTNIDGIEEDTVDCRREEELQDMGHKKQPFYTRRYLSALKYCVDCDRHIGTDTYNEVRDGATAPSPPWPLEQLVAQGGEGRDNQVEK